jgi:hypothetical protein
MRRSGLKPAPQEPAIFLKNQNCESKFSYKRRTAQHWFEPCLKDNTGSILSPAF